MTNEVGIDLGIKTLVTDNNGNEYVNIKGRSTKDKDARIPMKKCFFMLKLAEEAAVAEVNWFEHQVRNQYKITCNVTFNRSTPVTGAGYRPHLVAENDSEYKGVTFLDPLVIGENEYIRFEPLYPDRID